MICVVLASDRLVCRCLKVGASYNCDPQKVMDILLQIANQHPRLVKVPSSSAVFIGFGESSLDFNLSFWLDYPLIGETITHELGCAIWKAFAENEIEIPFPQRDLHIHSDNED